MAHAALNTFSISTRHWLPMNEFDKAIFNRAVPPALPSDGVLPQAVDINSTAAAAARSRAYRCTLIAAPAGFTATGRSRGVMVWPRRHPQPDLYSPHTHLWHGGHGPM